jgi:hypothetical protein
MPTRSGFLLFREQAAYAPPNTFTSWRVKGLHYFSLSFHEKDVFEPFSSRPLLPSRGVENVLQHIVGASTADETRLRTHAGSLYFTCPCSTESPIIFSHQFYAKDEFEESFCVTYTLLEPVWENTLVDSVKPQHSPPLGLHSFVARCPLRGYNKRNPSNSLRDPVYCVMPGLRASCSSDPPLAHTAPLPSCLQRLPYRIRGKREAHLWHVYDLSLLKGKQAFCKCQIPPDFVVNH